MTYNLILLRRIVALRVEISQLTGMVLVRRKREEDCGQGREVI